MSLWSTELNNLKIETAKTVHLKESVSKCVQLMREETLSCILVVNDQDELKGIFTEREFMNACVDTNLPDDLEVSTVMKRPAISLSPTNSLQDALDIMGKEKLRYLTIVNQNKKIEGILPVSSILEYMVEFFPKALLNIAPNTLLHSTNKEGG